MPRLWIRYLGFTTAGAVLVLDMCMGLMYRANLLKRLGPALVFVTASRAGLIAFGARYAVQVTPSL